MADRFDVVAIRIEDEGPKVDLMVLGAKTGTTVVAPDCRYGRLVESPHCRTVVGDLTSHGLSDRTDTYRIKYPSSDLLGEPARTLHAKFADAPSRPRRGGVGGSGCRSHPKGSGSTSPLSCKVSTATKPGLLAGHKSYQQLL